MTGTEKNETTDAMRLTDDEWKNDPHIIRVKGGDNPTDAVGLSRSILRALSKLEYCKVLTVGMKAEKIANAAFRMASEVVDSRQQGAVLVQRQMKFAPEINGKLSEGIAFRIFAMPIKYAL